MRNIVILALLISTIQIQAQDHYDKAYNYLNNCENLKLLDKKICKCRNSNQIPINVIDEIYPLSILIFGNEIVTSSIIPNSNIKESKTNLFITAFDESSNFKPYLNKSFSDKFKHNPKSQIYVGFSKIIDNMLFAELAYNLEASKKVKSIREITRFNKSLAVLFIFNEDGEIIDVKMNLNQYD